MTERRAGVAAVVPALNEAATIADVVAGLNANAIVIVVDDGSTDETAQLAAGAGAVVVTHSENRGYDGALGTGVSRAAAMGLTYAVTLDADGQHDPDLLNRFVAALEEGADLVVGVRDKHQRFSERVFAWVGRRAWGIDDPLCGMKGYRLSAFAEAGAFDRYKSIGTAFAIFAARSGLKIVQVAVQTRPRVGTPRFGSGLRANIIILRALALGLLGR